MTENAVQFGQEILVILGSVVILLAFAITVALPSQGGTRPGSSGHRRTEDDVGHEDIAADGFIDGFANEIEEAGGGIPLVVKLVIPVVLISYVVYLILNWAPPA
jgi:hypothetical protein